ncbi:MAG: hypothetical protein EZS28_029817 [Streblomastix strix]|uniref:Uncharacterized protein n=1 Tax=Streblomastix strix TaxID=222440 RepID=A0A5J4UVG3_9EUKA|nr:MAG: hypothetical protein EZS28_029817 [Streblomastix strix]
MGWPLRKTKKNRRKKLINLDSQQEIQQKKQTKCCFKNMSETTFRPDQTSIQCQSPAADVATVIPHLIVDIESDNINVHILALKQLLNIILDNRENKDLALKYNLYPILNKFTGNTVKNEEFVLSTTILHIIGIRNSTDDQSILAGIATESMILNIFTSDEKQSNAASNALEGLIEENEIIRNALLTNGFLLKVQQTFTNKSSSSSSSSQTSNATPNYLISGLLDIILKLLATVGDLQPIAILIPLLNEMKSSGEKNIKKKSMNILSILITNGINSPSSEPSKEKESKIQQLEESNRLKDEQLRQNVQLIRTAEERAHVNEQYKIQAEEQLRAQQEQTRASEERARLSEQQKLQVQEQLRTKEADNQRLQNEINQLRQTQAPSSATHSIQLIQAVVDRNAIIEDNKSELENPDPTGQGVRFERIQDLNRKAVALRCDRLSVSLNNVIKDGIHRIEVRFEKCNNVEYSYGAVGIVKAGYKIPYPSFPCNSEQRMTVIQSMLEYYGYFGQVLFKFSYESGNVKFSDGQLIAMELNADVGTLHFFVDGIQQPVFVRGIKEAVKFYFHIYFQGSSFSIVSVKKLPIPIAKTLLNEKVIQW